MPDLHDNDVTVTFYICCKQ